MTIVPAPSYRTGSLAPQRYHRVEIPEHLFRRLQALAKPLEDTTATVIERLLNFYEKGKRRRKALPEPVRPPGTPVGWPEMRTRTGTLSEDYLASLPLVTVADLGGRGETKHVIAQMRGDLAARAQLHAIDLEHNTGKGDWERWETSTRFARKHLVEDGLLRSGSPRGIWELSPAGWSRAKALGGNR